MVAMALPPFVAAAPARHGPSAPAMVHAAIVALSRRPSFKTVTTSPSLHEVTLVEPRAHREAATSHLDGPAGHGSLKVVVSGGTEYLKGDRAGLSDLLRLVHAPAATVATAASLASSWYAEPPAQAALVDRFGPDLRGVGHVFCTGGRCSTAGASVVGHHPHGEVVVAVPAFGGELVLDTTHHLRPVALIGTGAQKGLTMRFAYPAGSPPPILAPSSSKPAPRGLVG